jgi:HSP20 family molecular chaperone IbpA
VDHSQKPAFRFLAIRHYQAVGQRDWQPALNMYETDDSIVVIVEAAGISAENLTIEVESSMVRIQGVRETVAPEHARRLHRMEIAAGPFQLEVPLSTAVDPQQAHSRYRSGLIEIVLPLVRQPARRVEISNTEGEAHDDV